MKLVIQIPCHNEEETLPLVFQNMPKAIDGISELEFQIIDDGSTDKTVEVAKSLGVHHIIRVPGRNRRWLGRAFRLGVDAALARGADIVVNTDGDNQYPSERIPDLVAPIVAGKADIVIGDRAPSRFREFSFFKRLLQKLGNITASWASGEKVRDAVSGFRAYSKRALLHIHILTHFTYTVDTLIQAYKKGLEVHWIGITPNPKTRESRLITSLMSKVKKSGGTILRISALYQPFRVFLTFSLIAFIPGSYFITRFLYFFFYVPAERAGHIQSVVLGGVCLVVSFQLLVLGILAELLSSNRQLLENTLSRVKEIEILIRGKSDSND